MDEYMENYLKAFLAQTDSAVKISKIITEHSEDKILNGDRIVCGLVYRLMNPMTDEEIQQSMETAENLLNESESDYDSEEDSDKDSEDNNKKQHYLEDDDFSDYEEKLKNGEITTHKIVSNNCNCDICMEVRVCLLNYHNFECCDPLAQRFKDAINHTCEEHKVII